MGITTLLHAAMDEWDGRSSGGLDRQGPMRGLDENVPDNGHGRTNFRRYTVCVGQG